MNRARLIRSSAHRSASRSGAILIYTLLVIAALIAGVYTFSEWMTLEYRAIRAATDQIRTLQAAEGAVDRVLASVHSNRRPMAVGNETSMSYRWKDDRGDTLAVEILGGVPGTPWENLNQPLNECAKLNLNSIDLSLEKQFESRERLLAIPGMDAQTADSILDWLDDDAEPRQFGVESSWYLSAGKQPRAANGPLLDLKELLQVRGVTIARLFGEDTNGNGWLDRNEDDGQQTAPNDNGDGRLDGGWSQWLTVLSKESHLDRQGNPKINLNQKELATLYRQVDRLLGAEAARFVVSLRMTGPLDDPSQREQDRNNTLERRRELARLRAIAQTEETLAFDRVIAERFGDFIVDRPGTFLIESFADLLGYRVEVTMESQYTILNSPWTGQPSRIMDEWEYLHTHFCLGDEPNRPGSVHLDFADRPVLMSVPGMTMDLANRISSRRENTKRKRPIWNEAWLVAENLMTRDEFRKIAPYVTTRGDVYSGVAQAWIVGQPLHSAVSFLLDASGPTPWIRKLERHEAHLVPESWKRTQ